MNSTTQIKRKIITLPIHKVGHRGIEAILMKRTISDYEASPYGLDFIQWWIEKMKDVKWERRCEKMKEERKQNQEELEEFNKKLPLTIPHSEFDVYRFPKSVRYYIPHIHRKDKNIESITILQYGSRYKVNYNETQDSKTYREEFFASLPQTYEPKQFREVCKKLSLRLSVDIHAVRIVVSRTPTGCVCNQLDKRDESVRITNVKL